MNFFIIVTILAYVQAARSVDPLYADFLKTYMGGRAEEEPYNLATYEKRRGFNVNYDQLWL